MGRKSKFAPRTEYRMRGRGDGGVLHGSASIEDLDLR